MSNNSLPEYKEGDIVEIEGVTSKGVVLSHEGLFYSIKLLEHLEIKLIDSGNKKYHLEPTTYVKKMEAHVGLLRLVENKKEGKE